MSSKQHLREKSYTYRKELTEDEYFELSKIITYRLCYIQEFKRAENYHFFVGSPLKREIFTKPIIDVLLKSGRHVFVPKVTKQQTLSTHKIHTIHDLSPGAYGIDEPVTFETNFSDFECIIIPMLVADLKGNRLGYGKGFYDKFLPETKGVKIGLIYDASVTELLETQEHDVKMDLIVTEKRIIDLINGNIRVL